MQGAAKASQRPCMLTGQIVLQESTGGTEGGKTGVVDTDHPADTFKSCI